MSLPLRWLAGLTAASLTGASLRAQSHPATGSIAGRVLDRDTEQYLYQARVAVPGTALEAYTDSLGRYRLADLPAGEVKIEITYTGLPAVETTVEIRPGVESRDDFTLAHAEGTHASADEHTLVLPEFVVKPGVAATATAEAVNVQRRAPNMVTAVAVDELGFTGDGDIAGALKFLPGIDLEQDPTGYANGVTLSGAPSANVPVTLNHFVVTTAADLAQLSSSPLPTGSNNQRTSQLMQLSLANLSRIEIERSPTPETPGSSLAGSINFVPKSAFEYSAPKITTEAFLTANADNLSLSRSAGPLSGTQRQIFPGANVVAIIPVSDKFGFTVTVSRSETPRTFGQTDMTWSAGYDATANGGQGAYLALPNDSQHYYLAQYELDNMQSTYTRNSLDLTLDRKVGAYGLLMADFEQGYNVLLNGQRQVRWTIGPRQRDVNLATATLNSVQSASTLVANSTSEDYVLNNTYYQERQEKTRFGYLLYTYTGPVWRAEAGAAYGEARSQYTDLAHGFFYSTLYTISNASVSFNDVSEWGVGSISATVSGQPVNPMDLTSFGSVGAFSSSYVNPTTGTSTAVTSALPSLRSKPSYAADERKQGRVNLARDFEGGGVRTTVKVGAEYADYRRDQHFDPNLGTQSPAGFVYAGPSLPITTFLNTAYSTPLPALGVPTTLDNLAIGRYFLANQGSFVHLNLPNDYQTYVLNSKYIDESIASGYLRVDQHFLKNRLWLIYGVRFEETKDAGQGPLINPAGNYQTNAAGQVIDSTGKVVGTAGAGAAALLNPANSLAGKEAVYKARGDDAEARYGKWFPSVNVNIDLTQTLVARASYSQTIGRPDLMNIIPGIQFPDDTKAASSSNAFIASNPGLKPWHSQNAAFSLEYYSGELGDITLRLYRRWITDAFAQSTLDANDSRATATLQSYGISPADWPGFPVQTLTNAPGTVVNSGAELSSRYDLDSLLPDWAHGFQVKLTGSRNTLTGDPVVAANFGSQNLYVVPWSAGGDLSFSRSRFSVRVAAKWNAQERLNYITLPLVGTTNPSVVSDPNTYKYLAAQWRVDFDASLRVNRWLSLFVNGRDINHYTQRYLQFSPTTPSIARGLQANQFQPVWTAGVRGEF